MKNLTEKALLVYLSISQWSAHKYDKKVTSEVNHKHNTTDAGRFNKVLIAKDHLKAIQQIASKARDFHYENTLPWSDNGDRVLPSTNYFEYVAKLRELKAEFEEKVNAFVMNYPSLVEEAKTKLNGLFNANDYPRLDLIKDKFDFKSSFMPLATEDDFRVQLGEDEVKDLKNNIQSEINQRLNEAVQDIFNRVKAQLEHMHERLSDKDAVFRDSLFTNMSDLVKLLPRLNITNDSAINALVEDLKSLCVDPEAVRHSAHLRSAKANEVNSILKNMGALFNPVAA